MRTLVDCGCEAKVYPDGSGVEIEYCALHSSVEALLEACKAAYKLPRPWMDGGITWPEWDAACEQIEFAIARAEGE